MRDDSTWRLHFYPWFIAEEYKLPVDDDFTPNEEELEYATTVQRHTGFNLTPEQLLWRRQKIDEFGEDRQQGITPERYFDQEYPYSPESAFLASGYGIFSQLGISPHSPTTLTFPLSIFKQPLQGEQYVIGADPAEGLMQDESVAEVFRNSSRPEQVAEYASATIKPDEFAYELASLGRRYNDALIVVERNNHGLATLSHLKRIYPYGLIYKEHRLGKADYFDDVSEQLGIRTTSNKAKMVDDLYMMLRDGIVYYSTLFHDELMSFVETKSQTGHILLGAQEGCMDNRVMAAVMAMQGLLSYYRSMPTSPKKVVPYNSPLGIRDRLRKSGRRQGLIDSYLTERFG